MQTRKQKKPLIIGDEHWKELPVTKYQVTLCVPKGMGEVKVRPHLDNGLGRTIGFLSRAYFSSLMKRKKLCRLAGNPKETTYWLFVTPENAPAPKKVDVVNDPSHYGGKDNPYEVIKVLEAWKLEKNAYLWNTVKYIARADHKGNALQDLKKAQYYLNREIANREKGQPTNG